MKRKLFSAILFGACLVASTSGLTSCKDYDDDISNLQSQIDKLATKEELQEKAKNLEDKINAAQSSADNALEVAKAAQAAASQAATAADVDAAKKAAIDAANQAVADLKKELEGSLASKQELEQAAKAAEKVVTDLKSSLVGDSGLTIDQVMAIVNDAVNKVNDDKTGLDALEARLAAVEKKLTPEGSEEEIDLTEIQAELEDIEDAFEALVGVVSDMVTSVELVNAAPTLNFTIVTEQKNETFGKDVANEVLTTTQDLTRFVGADVLIRVNPVDAEISASDVSLINSKGEELTGLVEATKVERYSSKDYMTRAAGANTGLWKVTYAPVTGAKATDLEKKFKDDPDVDYQNGNYIVYAVAVKSAISDSISADRRVVSAYDVAMKTTPAVAYNGDPTTGVANQNLFKANGKYINTLQNRKSTINGIVNTLTSPWPKEYVWKTGQLNVKENGPAVTPVYSNGDINVTEGDNRDGSSFNLLVVKPGDDIKIEFDEKIKGFYVVLDYKFALDKSSANDPSEINAWNSYQYDGIANLGPDGKVIGNQKATMFTSNDGIVRVNSLRNEVKNDIIGLRVFAMNLDGTLLDPDGVAFYVSVGEDKSNVPVGDVTAVVDKKDYEVTGFSFPKGTLANAEDKTGGAAGSAVTWTIKNGDAAVASGWQIKYYWADDTNPGWEAWNDLHKGKYNAVKFILTDPTQFKDNATFSINCAVNQKSNNTDYTAFNLTGSFTKNLPTSAPAYVFNVGQTEEQILKADGGSYAYAITDPNSLAGAKNGVFDYNDAFIQSKSGNPYISQDDQFQFYLANSAQESAGKPYDKPLETLADGSNAPYTYKATIPYGLIDNATPHAVSTTYNYGAISSQTFENRASTHEHDWIVNTTSGYSIKYMTWSYQATGYMQYAWLTKAFKDGSTNVTKTFDEVLNGGSFKIDLSRVVANPGNKISQELRKADLKAYADGTANAWLKVINVETEADGIQNPYYKFNNATTGVVTMDRKAGVNNVPEHTATLKIKVQDCFGHVEIISLTVKFVNDKPTYIWDGANGKVQKLQEGGSYANL